MSAGGRKVHDTLVYVGVAINRHRYLEPSGRNPTMDEYILRSTDVLTETICKETILWYLS